MDLHLALQYDLFAGDFGTPGDRAFKDKIVTFRKGGPCCECLSPIKPKTQGRSCTMYWQGDGVQTYRFCNDCTVAMFQCIMQEDFEPMEIRFSLGNHRRENMNLDENNDRHGAITEQRNR